jgi:hypothetical protein
VGAVDGAAAKPALSADPSALQGAAQALAGSDGTSSGAVAVAQRAGRAPSASGPLQTRLLQTTGDARARPPAVDGGVEVLRALAKVRFGGDLKPETEAKLREIQTKLNAMAAKLEQAKNPAEKAKIIADAFTHVGREHPEGFQDATLGQHAVVGSAVALMATLATRTVLSVHTLPQVIGLAAGAMMGGVGSNKLSAFVHHALDNYGFERAPWIAKQAEEFIAHHIDPQAEAKESWALTAFSMSQAIAPIMVGLLAANPAVSASAFAATLALGSLMSTENHKMAHRPSSEVPLAYDIAQLLGLSLSKEDHRRHHINPHGNHYAVVRDTAPDDGPAFRQWEALIYRLSGVEPNSWKHDPKLRVEALGPQAHDERAVAAVALRDREYDDLKAKKREQDLRLGRGEALADGEARITPRDLRLKAEEIPDRHRIAPADHEGASGGPFVGNLRTLFARG